MVGLWRRPAKMSNRTLIFIPTYDERENAPVMCREIFQLNLNADVLFMDDSSPDRTVEALRALQSDYPRLLVQCRASKLGIGSAHLDGIQWAYENGYQTLVTLDCDFTHAPSDISAMIAATGSVAVSVGSRWLRKESLPGWNIFRRSMTIFGHVLTRCVLGLPYDASGAFRAYRLDRIPREMFSLVSSKGYPFFFESLFILHKNQISIREVPIILPARTYGNSKMTTLAAIRSACFVFELAFRNLVRPKRYLLSPDPGDSSAE